MPRQKKDEVALPNVDYTNLQEKLIQNLIDLQKVHTNMAEKFDNLSNQITSLLSLFENAARSFADNPANLTTEKDKEFLNKIDKLLEQNKTIAKGLTIMEERIRERVYSGSEQESNEDYPKAQQSASRPLPKF